ncbi:hypothetical protein VKT23_009325 [Stygiomarasmius scandens]|uniref:Retroviral polymerase SH3-like domain-containing protein n=1 Tax=Marasmiellus scandens TaxID=2682957 RepID=A0ABR1JJQ1_9AGAR
MEAIFVGYEEHRIGWRVHDINGKYHFSRDVIFNESAYGRLGSRRTTDPWVSPPTSVLGPRDPIVTRSTSKTMGTGTNTHFLSMFASLPLSDSIYALLSSIDIVNSIDRRNEFVSLEDMYAFFSVPSNPIIPKRLPLRRNWDLNSPPPNFCEALARPDSDLWHAAMSQEVDSLCLLEVFEQIDALPEVKFVKSSRMTWKCEDPCGETTGCGPQVSMWRSSSGALAWFP